MKEVESRRMVPVSAITLISVVVLALVQLFMITESYEVKASTVKKVAPWFYDSFRKMVGEHPSTNPMTAKPVEDAGPASSGIETVAGFNPEELSVTIEGAEPTVLEPTTPNAEVPVSVIPVSTPAEVLDDDEPVG